MFVPEGRLITYEDVDGGLRKVKCIERVEDLVRWHRAKPYSGAARYECEDGHVIQIPDDAWALVKIISEK